MKQKRIVTIQDLSCFGKCSITTALPVLSALGIETAVIPTAVLSTHTGEFKNYTFHSLSGEFEKIADHWEALGIEFDAIYVGYIGTCELARAVSNFIDRFRKNAIVFIDPAMADNAKFYSGLDMEYAEVLTELCKKADVISPNLTEALILCGESADKKSKSLYDKKEIENLLHTLSDKFENDIIITGIPYDNFVLTASFDRKTKRTAFSERAMHSGNFYGSGDLFASSFIGIRLNGETLENSVEKATAFVSDCIDKTLDEREKYWYGLKFEHSLGVLLH